MNMQFASTPILVPTWAPALTPASMVSLPPITKDEINALHNEFCDYGRKAKHWLRQCQMMLPKIRDEEVWKKKGYDSIYDYARILAGMSRNSVNEALRILDCIEDKPELKKSVEKFGLNKVSPVITIATESTDEFWADKVETMSVQALKTYVREYRRDGLDVQGQRPQDQDWDMSNGEFCLGDSGDCEVSEEGSDTAGDRKTAPVYMKLDVKTIERMKKLKGDDDWDELLNRMLDMYEVLADSGEVGFRESEEKPGQCNAASHCETRRKPAPINTGKRYIPRKIQKYVTKKTSGLCATHAIAWISP